MHFRHGSQDEPEINLIPFIDVLLVVLIFLMLSTTYGKFTEMEVRLRCGRAEAQRDRPKEIIVAVGADGRYAVNKTVLPERGVDASPPALAAAAGGNKDNVVIISADATAAHLVSDHGDGSGAARPAPHADHLRHADRGAGLALTAPDRSPPCCSVHGCTAACWPACCGRSPSSTRAVYALRRSLSPRLEGRERRGHCPASSLWATSWPAVPERRPS